MRPIVDAVGIDPIRFGILMTLDFAIGQQTPPLASVPTISCSIARANIWETTRINVYFIAVLIAVLIGVTYVPAVSLGLVRLFY